jgi:hypothetical protein
VIANNQDRPANVELDDTCVYRADQDGTIMRAPK